MKPDFIKNEDCSRPNWLALGNHSGHYWISFSGVLMKYEFELNGGSVTILSADGGLP